MKDTVGSTKYLPGRSFRTQEMGVKAWCKKTGNDLVALAEKGDHFEAEVRRAG
jgi:hypothetical protein